MRAPSKRVAKATVVTAEAKAKTSPDQLPATVRKSPW
jgi:hypothetical protein